MGHHPGCESPGNRSYPGIRNCPGCPSRPGIGTTPGTGAAPRVGTAPGLPRGSELTASLSGDNPTCRAREAPPAPSGAAGRGIIRDANPPGSQNCPGDRNYPGVRSCRRGRGSEPSRVSEPQRGPELPRGSEPLRGPELPQGSGLGSTQGFGAAPGVGAALGFGTTPGFRICPGGRSRPGVAPQRRGRVRSRGGSARSAPVPIPSHWPRSLRASPLPPAFVRRPSRAAAERCRAELSWSEQRRELGAEVVTPARVALHVPPRVTPVSPSSTPPFCGRWVRASAKSFVLLIILLSAAVTESFAAGSGFRGFFFLPFSSCKRELVPAAVFGEPWGSPGALPKRRTRVAVSVGAERIERTDLPRGSPHTPALC